MFNADRFKRLYYRFLGENGRAVDITLKVNNGTDFDLHADVRAHISSFQESDLVAGGPSKVGDMRLIILAETLPEGLRPLTEKDQVEIDGRPYGVINWDTRSRAIGSEVIAVDAIVRGG